MKILSLFNLNEDGTDSNEITRITWGEYDVETGIKKVNGKTNTTLLVALGSEYKAAIACSLYVTEGTNQGDWYLPARRELVDMEWNTNKEAIQASLNSLDSMGRLMDLVGGYWSSTECTSETSYALACGEDYMIG